MSAGYVAERFRRLTVEADKILQNRVASRRSQSVHAVGCYFQRNVGDVALGIATTAAAGRVGVDSYRLPLGLAANRIPQSQGAILGGGGVLTPHAKSGLENIARWAQQSRTPLSGVGLSGDFYRAEIGDEVTSMLRDAKFLGVRDEETAATVRRETGRTDVVVHPDLAFSLPAVLELPGVHRRKRIGINVLPVLMKRESGKWRSLTAVSPWFKSRFPVQAARVEEVGPGAIWLLRKLVTMWKSRGYDVAHIPFAEEDAAIAKEAFSGMQVELYRPTSSVRTTLARVAQCEALIGMRFHSAVFGLVTGTPTQLISYAPKGTLLWTSLGLPRAALVTPEQWLESPSSAVDRLSSSAGGVLASNTLKTLCREAGLAAENAYRSVLEE